MSTMQRSFKKPFQPSISSYFGRSPTETETVRTPKSSIPTLPGTIQSSLLNVGMRVRKSVPEGYKTRPKTLCAPATPAEHTASNGTHPASQHGRNASAAFTALVPYCGILTAGGHGVEQSVPTEEDTPPPRSDNEGWDLLATSGWGSTMSTMSTNTIASTSAPTETIDSNKRRREDADEEDLDVEAQPVSPRSRPISHTRMPNLDQLRAIAVPKPRRKVMFKGGLKETDIMDLGDFEGAKFLRPDEWGGHFSWQDGK